MPLGSGVRWSTIPALLLSSSLSPAKNVLPPPARDAGPSGPEVRITHTHRVVRACGLKNPATELRCAAMLEPADAETNLTLGPIPPASLERHADTRRAVEISVPPGRPTSTTISGLAPGLWEVAWPSYQHRPRFNAKPGDKVELALETTTGRCDAARGQCTLIPDASTTRVRISEAPRKIEAHAMPPVTPGGWPLSPDNCMPSPDMASPTYPHLLLMVLYAHLESLDDLAVLLWLGRHRNASASAATVAEHVGVDEDQALKVLEHFVQLGLVEEYAKTGSSSYGLACALPPNLVGDLGAYHALKRPN